MNIELGDTKLPSIINDPFAKNRVTAIRLHYYPQRGNCNGSVEFENGATKGEQNFNGSSFDEVVLKMKAMLENMS